MAKRKLSEKVSTTKRRRKDTVNITTKVIDELLTTPTGRRKNVEMFIRSDPEGNFLSVPFKLLKRYAKKMNAAALKIIRHIKKDNLNGVIAILQQTNATFRKFVKLARICINLFEVVPGKKANKLSTRFKKICAACQNAFFQKAIGLSSIVKKYRISMFNVDLEILTVLDHYVEVELMYIQCCLQNIEKLMNKFD